MDLTYRVYFREGVWSWRERVGRDKECHAAFYLPDYQRMPTPLLFPRSIHSFIHSFLTYSTHISRVPCCLPGIWYWASAMTKNSLCVCPKEFWWVMTCHDLISSSRSMVNKPCLIRCWIISVFWRFLDVLCCKVWMPRGVLLWEAPPIWSLQLNKIACIWQENNRQLGHVCTFSLYKTFKGQFTRAYEIIRYIGVI